MAFQIGSRPNFSPMKHLHEHGADRLDGGIGQQQLDVAATVLHVDMQPHQNGGVGRPADGGKARIGFQPVDRERHRRQRPERLFGIGQHHFDQPFDEVGLDRGVGAAFDPQRGLAAAAASSTSTIE